MNDVFARIYQSVRGIPEGKVMSYGSVALRAGLMPSAARVVGWALRALPPGTDVPWQRVINRKGILTIINPHVTANEQRTLLEREGVIVVEQDGVFKVDQEFFID